MTNEEKYNLITELGYIQGYIKELTILLDNLANIRFDYTDDKLRQSTANFTLNVEEKIINLKSRKQEIKNIILKDWAGLSIPELMTGKIKL